MPTESRSIVGGMLWAEPRYLRIHLHYFAALRLCVNALSPSRFGINSRQAAKSQLTAKECHADHDPSSLRGL